MSTEKFTVAEQITYMKNKGIRFYLCDDQTAYNYLENNNHFFKLMSYRKNFNQNSESKYINLDFAHLKDIATIDMHMRYLFLSMCLDIEHIAKLKIIHAVENSDDISSCALVEDYKNSHAAKYNEILQRTNNNCYTNNLKIKYENNMPIWVFLELTTFATNCYLFSYVANKINNDEMKKEGYILYEIKNLRNACAHSNCLLNDLKPNNIKYTNSKKILSVVSKIPTISESTRKSKLSNQRIVQITYILYLYKDFIKSSKLLSKRKEELYNLFYKRIYKNSDFIDKSESLQSFFNYIQKLLDTWYSLC